MALTFLGHIFLKNISVLIDSTPLSPDWKGGEGHQDSVSGTFEEEPPRMGFFDDQEGVSSSVMVTMGQ